LQKEAANNAKQRTEDLQHELRRTNKAASLTQEKNANLVMKE